MYIPWFKISDNLKWGIRDSGTSEEGLGVLAIFFSFLPDPVGLLSREFGGSVFGWLID